jgi:transcriptional regulator with XRE-family HTH domain
VAIQYKVMNYVFDLPRFGYAVFHARHRAYLKQRELAELIGVSGAAVNRIENARGGEPAMSTYLALCNALDLRPQDYFSLEDEV